MEDTKVIFELDGNNLIIQCSGQDKMKDICQKYATKIDKNIDSLLFLYEGNKINLELTFSNQANSIDRNNGEMKILVNKKENNKSFSPNCMKDDNVTYGKELLKNVKSKYIVNIFFSFINERIKLKIVKHNKHLQDIINIKLINYEFLSGRYIIYDNNGIVKEYYGNNDYLIFEGEYLNGLRNGKGKEYNYEGKLKFEGEYLNGNKWNGKGYDGSNNVVYELKNGKGYVKEYYSDGILSFEGEYLNGLRNGKGKEYNYEGILEFEGEYFNENKWNGKGYEGFGENNIVYELKNGKGYIKEYNSGILSFEGEYLYGERNGKGKEYDYNGILIFEGEYINGLRNGKGKNYDENRNIIFDGEYLYNSKLRGREFINNKLVFEGEYLFNKSRNGKGYDKNGNIIYELKNGNGYVKEYDYLGILKFEGEYLNGKRNGKGKEYDYEGKLEFEGEYLNGERKGKGKKYYNGMLEFEGEYLNGKRNGKGKEYDYRCRLRFEGEYLNGERNGKGKEYDYEGILKFEGEYLNGERNGKGKEYNYNGILEFEGEYLNGQRI